jgi:hypothetical protein
MRSTDTSILLHTDARCEGFPGFINLIARPFVRYAIWGARHHVSVAVFSAPFEAHRSVYVAQPVDGACSPRACVDGVSWHPDDRSVQADSRYPGFALHGERNAGSGKPRSCGNTSMCFAGERRSDRTSTIRIVFDLFGSIAGFRPSLRLVAIVRPETIILG